MDDAELKKKADRLMNIECKTLGSEIQALLSYIQFKYGDEGLKKILDKCRDLGYPINQSQIRLGEWYKEGLNVLLFLLAKELFQWTDQDLFQMGRDTTKMSLGVKMFIKYFVSIKKVFQSCPGYWRKFMDCGNMEAHEFSNEKRYAIFRLTGYDFEPFMCHYFKGFIFGIAENALPGEHKLVEETACIYKGDPYHEFLVKW